MLSSFAEWRPYELHEDDKAAVPVGQGIHNELLQFNNDRQLCIDNGPVTSKIYDLIKESHTDTGTYWASYIRTEEYDAVLIKKEEEYLCMSPMEMQVLADVNEKFKEQSVWDVVDFCHKNLKEWQNPAGSTIPISIEDIIRASTDDSNVKDCIDEMKLAAFVQKSNFYEIRDLRP